MPFAQPSGEAENYLSRNEGAIAFCGVAFFIANLRMSAISQHFIHSMVGLKPKKYGTNRRQRKSGWNFSRLQPPLLTIFIMRHIEHPHHARC
jgi:hypothetical protein